MTRKLPFGAFIFICCIEGKTVFMFIIMYRSIFRLGFAVCILIGLNCRCFCQLFSDLAVTSDSRQSIVKQLVAVTQLVFIISSL